MAKSSPTAPNDELIFETMSTANQSPSDPPPKIFKPADNVFVYGSGPFNLEPGESQRFSIALILGSDLTGWPVSAVVRVCTASSL